MYTQLLPAIRLVLIFTVLTGLIYPLAVTGICQLLFPQQANGSLISANGKVIGSQLLAQDFKKPGYFHARPSAAGNGYDPTASGGSNLGPTNQKLIDRIKASKADFEKTNPGSTGSLPSDLLTTSGSGLDPDISPASAAAQVPRVAAARKLPFDALQSLIQTHTRPRDLGFLGEPRVNVLELNLALDGIRH